MNPPGPAGYRAYRYSTKNFQYYPHGHAASLIGALDEASLARRTTANAVPHLADLCVMDVRGADGRFVRIGVAGATEDPRVIAAVWEGGVASADGALPSAGEEGSPAFVAPDFFGTPAASARPEGSRPRSAWLRDAASIIVVPLRACETTDGWLGFIRFGTRAERPRDLGTYRAFADPVESALAQVRALGHLRADVEGRETLISVASHELKTPLTALGLRVAVMRRELASLPLTPEARRRLEGFLGACDRSVRRLTGSVGELFNVAEIKSGHLSLDLRQLDLGQFLTECLIPLEPLLEDAGCPLEFIAAPGIEARIDPRRLERAIGNLVANATKYARGCAVEIRLERAGSGWARITVTDRGPGIAPQDQTRLFDAFHRAEERAGTEGLGLGLFVARGVVQAHGGRLELRSAVGEGTEFAIDLPVLDGSAWPLTT